MSYDGTSLVCSHPITTYSGGNGIYIYPGSEFTSDNSVCTPKRVRRFQQSFGIAPDLLHNINGHDLSGTYGTTTVTIGGYPGVKITQDGSNVGYDSACNYMRKMTGSEYLPQFGDGTVPQYSYLVAGDGKIYKPQYDGTNGLVLYYINQFAFKSDIPSTSNFVNLTGTQTITGAKTFQNNCLTISYSGYGAPALKLTGSSSGYAGTTVLQAGTPGGATRTITLPSTDGTLALTSYVQANPGSGSTALSTIKINGSNYYLSATANIPIVDIRS